MSVADGDAGIANTDQPGYGKEKTRSTGAGVFLADAKNVKVDKSGRRNKRIA